MRRFLSLYIVVYFLVLSFVFIVAYFNYCKMIQQIDALEKSIALVNSELLSANNKLLSAVSAPNLNVAPYSPIAGLNYYIYFGIGVIVCLGLCYWFYNPEISTTFATQISTTWNTISRSIVEQTISQSDAKDVVDLVDKSVEIQTLLLERVEYLNLKLISLEWQINNLSQTNLSTIQEISSSGLSSGFGF